MVVYVSSAVNLFSPEQLDELLEKSRHNNSNAGITGMLMYKDGNFMQFLEGPKDEVLRCLQRIKADPRHRGLIVLMQQEREHREFEQWDMAFQKEDASVDFEVAGYSDFLNLPITSEDFLLNPSKSLKLLLNFKSIMR